MPSEDLVLFKNIPLSDQAIAGHTSTVGEPSVAHNGHAIFMTGNWYATKSLDNGASWEFVSPFNALPAPEPGFCCDQTVLFDPSRNLTFWILQYKREQGTNVLRLAVNSNATLASDQWYWWDFSPESVDPNWSNEWFDYNSAALSDNFLYVTSNVFRGNVFRRGMVFRFPLDDLAAGSSLSFSHFSDPNGTLRCTLGASSVMYIGTHRNQSGIRLFALPEDGKTISVQDIDVSPWRGGVYSAPGPNGHNWMKRCDGRITGAWVSNGVIGFMWSVNSQGNSRPFPYVRVVRINEETKEVLNEPDIWSSQYAFAYPDACPNDSGDVGVTLFRGGGSRFPGHIVGMWDDERLKWQMLATRDSSHGPNDVKWGDYITCRRHGGKGMTWLATGYTLQGGGSRLEIEPQFVHFGMEKDR